MSEEIKRMDIKEFREEGFLQEVNRQFFHPLGLALSIAVDWPKGITRSEKKRYENPIDHPEARYSLGDIFDFRGDTEGCLYGKNQIDIKLKENIDRFRKSKLPVRLKLKDININTHGIQED